jgi:ATP-binding cassette, subfamily F, member 3
VEQEVVGDDTPALDSVLQCDTVRENLIREEREINAKISAGYHSIIIKHHKRNSHGIIYSRNGDAEMNAKLSEVYAQLQLIEADKAPARASIILVGLGFSPEKQKRPTKEFSGGWRMRLALARALFSKYVLFVVLNL